MTDERVTEILADHGLTREKAAKFVALSPAYNRKAVADEIGMHEDTAHRYRRAFKAMSVVDRLYLIAVLATDLHDELAEEPLIEGVRSE